jgi:anaerobic magnesium-protoporphyrin IX monomethyl ester cyclase
MKPIAAPAGLTADQGLSRSRPRQGDARDFDRRMLSILVGHSYFLRFDRKQLQRAKPYPPLATLQVAAMLRDTGHRVTVFDAMLAEDAREYDALLQAAQPQLALFYEDNFNFLSKMCLDRMRQACCEMIASARRNGARVIVAGSDASDAPSAYLAAGAEVVLVGEGLQALHTLVRRLDCDPQLSLEELIADVRGVIAATTAKSTASTPLQVTEQQHPVVPAWDLIDIERYRSMWRAAHGYFSLNMASSRGCSFRCTWCAKPIWGNRYMQRPAEEVAQELAYLKRTFQPDHIWFADDIFGFKVDWVTSFAAAVESLDGALPFTIQIRADLLNEKMARALKQAGCAEAWIGAESGSQKVLDAMNKGVRVDEVLAARARLNAVGIRVGFFIQLGYLGEQLEDILATRELIESASPDDVGVSVAYPLPGTKFYELVKHELRAKTHWNDSNDLDMMFEGTYKSDFYRAIRDLLHDHVVVERLRESEESAQRYRDEKSSLERRWQVLIAGERQYRTGIQRTVAAN